MCGHVGIISKNQSGLFAKDLTIFEEMLYIDALRGEDATGVCLVTRMQGAQVYKEASHAAWFLGQKDYQKGADNFVQDGRALLGHNRKATVGGAKDENAHPFILDDNSVFFHNGTLYNHTTIAKTEVDSEALGMLFSSCEGDIAKFSEAIDKVMGAYACVWYDVNKNTIYFLRNAQRPLCYLETDTGDIIYASEAWMAYGVALRNNVKIKENHVFDVDTLYSIDLSKPTEMKKEIIPKKLKPSPVTLMEKASHLTTGIKTLSKLELRRTRREIQRSDYHCFYPDDVVCLVEEDPQPNQTYDWLILGGFPGYPGVQFQYVWKNVYEHETLGLYRCMAHGTFLDMSVSKGTLIVELQNVKFVESKTRQH